MAVGILFPKINFRYIYLPEKMWIENDIFEEKNNDNKNIKEHALKEGVFNHYRLKVP